MINTLDMIRVIDRKQEVPHEGAMCDLMWSDPDEDVEIWDSSARRDTSSAPTSKKFTTRTISLICRAHQLIMAGYKMMFDETLCTVWSAPNYCYRCNNIAAILEMDEHLKPHQDFQGRARRPRRAPSKQPTPTA